MQFVVYDATAGTRIARPVLRWGQCSPQMVPHQAINPGEVALAVEGFDPPDSAGAALTIDPVTGAWSAHT